MQNITSIAGLKNAIQLLEAEQAYNGQLLKEQLYFTRESFKPVNLLRGALKDITSSPSFSDNIIGTTIGLAGGYLSKKIFIGTSDNIFRKLFGSILQLGVTKVVAQNPEAIKSFGQYIFQHIFHKNNMNSENYD